MNRVYVQLPEGFTGGPTWRLGPFVSRQEVVRRDGTRLVLESRWHRKHPVGGRHGSTWWAPSVAFGVSAIASYAKTNEQLVSPALSNLGTFVSAICFLGGGLFLLPERTAPAPASVRA